MLQAGIDVKAARRNAMVLASAQALVGSAAPVAISTGGLAGTFLLDADKTLATLPVTAFNVGVAIGALPAAALMRAIGRRYGFICGTFGATLGGLIASFALFQLSFWLFALGLLVIGLGNAFTDVGKAECIATHWINPSSAGPPLLSRIQGSDRRLSGSGWPRPGNCPDK